MKTKECSKCKNEKPVEEFFPNKQQSSGLSPRCKQCTKEDAHLYYLRNTEKIKEQAKRYYEENAESVRARHKTWKRDNSKKRYEVNKIWCQENRIKCRAYTAKWYKQNTERASAYRSKTWKENTEKERNALAKWRRENPEKEAARKARRRAIKLQAIPSWADHAKIEAVYAKAAEHGHTVDHIAPLNSDKLCGLHVHYNLMVLTRSDNSIKSNKVCPVLIIFA